MKGSSCTAGLLLSAVIQLSSADFTPNFANYLRANLGQGALDELERKDIQGKGLVSYGGKEAPKEKVTHDPVVVVHGLNNVGNRFMDMIHLLHSRGWRKSETYMTTWGDAHKEAFGIADMKCKHVKQIRNLIQSVYNYVGRKVDIIAYSMGSPITRKSILGGKCVDTGEDIGPQITQMVDTFVSVAGSNKGSYLCGIPWLGTTCNTKTGLFCFSDFLNDVNSKQGYEAAHIFSIYSTNDDKIGHEACGKKLSPIDGSHQVIVRGEGHDAVMDNTREEQFKFITGHHV